MSIDPTQKEAEELQYSLRSTFFYRRHKEFYKLVQAVDKIDPSIYDWTSPTSLSISETSWHYIQTKGIPYSQVLCHPDIISQNPSLIAYYRLVAVLPQKGLQRLAFGVNALEEGTRRSLRKDRALLLAKVFNSYISSIVDSDPSFSVEGARLAALMNFGTQVNGSWRNEIGTEGGRRTKELILRHFMDTSSVKQVTAKNGTAISPKTTLPPIDEIQGFVATNGYKVIFASEPDISIISPEDRLEGAVEVKAGIDPAGALERYGAAKKSFDKALRENKACTTVYLASCITEGVKKAMADDRLVKQDFNLTKVFVDENARKDFLSYIEWLMHLERRK